MIFFSFFLISIISISRTRFPQKFSYFQNSISSTGSPITNPRGHKIFRAGVIVVGIAKIPDFVFIYSKLFAVSEIASNLFLCFGIIATISFSFVGLIPETNKKPHYLFAQMSFFFYFLTINIVLFLLYSVSNSTRFVVILFHFSFNISFIILIVTFLKNGMKKVDNLKSKYLSFPLWEWIFFLMIVVFISTIIFVLK
jgi:hypothetical protein